MITRRKFLNGATALGGFAVAGQMLPKWAMSNGLADMTGLNVLSGQSFDLDINQTSVLVDGKRGRGITVNDQLPAPLLRWREGDDVTLRVKNNLGVDSSIHWHGILLPFQMDGVPGLSFPGIKAGETFTYKFPLKQAGTYWYHSHSGLQEQSGLYGPIIIDPKEPDPVPFDREYVVVLSDWTFKDPHHVFSNLKKMGDFYNFELPTVDDFLNDAKEKGFSQTLDDRQMWGKMRMNKSDIADVTAQEYTYLLNGHSAADNWTALYEPGERVKLRFINASAMSFFNVRIPGLPMTVVAADGLNVKPVETDEFQIGVAETYDVVIEPHHGMAFTLMCESIDRSGYVRATIATQEGAKATVPPLRPPPKLTMKDMGMSHEGMSHEGMDMPDMGMSHDGMSHEGMDMPDMDMGEMDHSTMDHSSMGHDMAMAEEKPMEMVMENAMPEMDYSTSPQAHNHRVDFGVANVAEVTSSRLNEPGIGLDNLPHRALTYADLRSYDMNPDMRPPERELEIHLTGNMERYMWSLDGMKFSEVKEPIMFHEGERLRMTLVNDTMMPHPIHLHGMFFDVVNGGGHFKPRKHTIIVKPAEKLSIDITADAVGDWAFHCHLLFHMHAGMMQAVSVMEHKMDMGGAK